MTQPRFAAICVTIVALSLVGFLAWAWSAAEGRRQAEGAAVAAEVSAKVAKNRMNLAVATHAIENEAHGTIANARTRARRAAAAIQAAEATPGADADAAFYRGMCASRFYAGSAECVGQSSGPEGGYP